jgi:hypothetical protein
VTQPGFFEFAYELIELYPRDERAILASIPPVLDQPGFASGFEYLDLALDLINSELKRQAAPAAARPWLESLPKALAQRKSEELKHFPSSEPPFWE